METTAQNSYKRRINVVFGTLSVLAVILYISFPFYSGFLLENGMKTQAVLIQWERGLCGGRRNGGWTPHFCAHYSFSYVVNGKEYEKLGSLSESVVMKMQDTCYGTWWLSVRPTFVTVTYLPSFPAIAEPTFAYRLPRRNFDNETRDIGRTFQSSSNPHIAKRATDIAMLSWCWTVPGAGKGY